MSKAHVVLSKDSDSLAVDAADLITRWAIDSIQERGRFTCVLTGGSTPETTYAQLARPERAALIDWTRTFLFWTDERLVPPDDPRSNFGMARRSLLSHIDVPDANVHPMRTQYRSAAEAAKAHAEDLAQFFGRSDGPPSFDVILLGLGEDGHVASLFPGAPSLEITKEWVTSSPPGALPPPVDRISLTFPVLNAAKQVVFLVAGEKKATIVRDITEGADQGTFPASRVRPKHGVPLWLLDKSAARLLIQDS